MLPEVGVEADRSERVHRELGILFGACAADSDPSDEQAGGPKREAAAGKNEARIRSAQLLLVVARNRLQEFVGRRVERTGRERFCDCYSR